MREELVLIFFSSSAFSNAVEVCHILTGVQQCALITFLLKVNESFPLTSVGV